MLLGACGLVVASLVYADTGSGPRQAVIESNAQQGELALLSIARLELEVPIFSGTSKKTLNRGAGLVEGTSPPGAAGNIVISAHRDSYFRPLKDIRIGDVIELQLRDGMQRFEVGKIFITDPLDVSVLEPTAQPTLTLITCYPFYYVGFAPERFIVRATQIGT